MAIPDQYVVLLEKSVTENKKLQETVINLTRQIQSSQVASSSPPPPVSGTQRKSPSPKVSQHCRNSARHCYKELLQKEDFDGFDLSLTFGDSKNKAVLKRVMRAIMDENSNPDGCLFSANEIKVAVKRYFKSLKDGEHKKDTGKEQAHRVKCRRQARVNENCRRLKIGLSKTTWPVEKKDKVAKILTARYMDEEISDNEELEDGRTLCMGYKVKPLEWLHPRVRCLQKELMDEYLKSLPVHQRSAFRQRRLTRDTPSAKQKPGDCPDWVTTGVF